jgi:hypothetical protein
VKLVSPESLNDLQRSILEGYSRFFPSGAVCVNVMLGSEPWDIRPLLLTLGKVSLARFSMTLSESVARSLATDLEGFSVLATSQQRAQLLPGEGRVMLLRPYFPSTLKDDLDQGLIAGQEQRLALVQALIQRVTELSRRSIAHGHICPSNIIRDGSGVMLIDPVVGALHQTPDSYLAPETSLGKPPEPAADLYGLGRTIASLCGDAILSARQRTLVEQLLLPSPRQRPPLEEVSFLFEAKEAVHAEGSLHKVDQAKTSAGRVVKSASMPQQPAKKDDAANVSADRSVLSQSRKSSPVLTGFLVAVGGVFVASWIIKDRDPALYFELASRLPILAAQHSAEYESEWASRDRGRMAVVGRAGVIRREPAAINTIVNDLMAGANPEGVNGAVMRVAMADGWRDELGPNDKHTALVFALEGLVPEGRAHISSVADLHAGVLLAILGKAPQSAIPTELLQLPVDTLVRLSAPFGELFAATKAMGVQKLGDPTARGLAAIVTGGTDSKAFDSFLGRESQAAHILAKVSLVLPIISTNDAAANELLGVLSDHGGNISTLVHWFEMSDVAGWSSVRAADKIALILGGLPQAQLNVAQLSDLLTFPLEKIRGEAASKLREVIPGQQGERLLLTLTTPANGLTREQTVSLLSALALSPEARSPFVPAWFNLEPSPDAVLLILLSRSNADGNDLFNLEAARYLRRTQWGANHDILKLLAGHPEPLARVLAYGRLDPSVDADRSILLERQSREKEESCLKVLKDRLQSYRK